MPVRFRGISEYSSVYKWQPSYRSAQFTPQKEQLQPEAGLRSDQLNLLMEPLFTKKKQVPHRRPEAGDCLIWMRDDFDDLVSETNSANQPCNLNIKQFLVSKTRGGDVSKRSDKSKTPLPDDKSTNVKQPDSSKTNDSKCTWEKDKQSSFVQVFRKEEASPKEKKSPKKRKEKLSDLPLKEKKSPKKDKNAFSKTKSIKNSSHKSVPKDSPVKPLSKSPDKKEKLNNKPLRYRPLHQRMLSSHQSEYQQMYKKPSRFVPSSPLISALDVVHSSSPVIPPHKSPKMICKSEYASKYKNQSPLSKSMPNFSSPPSPSQRLKVRDLSSSYSLKHSPNKNQSEYANQFPARKVAQDVSKKLSDEAIHNKLNREGTAFDKDHINQICSPKNKCWDMSSTASEISVKTKESLCTSSERSNVVEEREKSKLSPVLEVENESRPEDIESITVSEKDSLDVRSAISNNTLNQPMPVARKLAWEEDENDDDDDTTVQGSVDSVSLTNDGFVGRLPTPQLKDIGGALRTHHDLTTPNFGEMVLTSPSSSNKKKKLVHSATPPSIAYNIAFDDKPVKLSKTVPTPTKQTDANIEKETVKMSVPPITTPSKETVEQVKERTTKLEKKPDLSKVDIVKGSRSAEIPRRIQRTLRVPIQGALRNQEFQHCSDYSKPSTAFERIEMASSASIASADDLLQRSLQRKDFWKTR